MHRLDPALEGLLSSLREMLTVSGEDEALTHLSPKEKRQKTFEAMRVLTVAGSRGART